MEIARVDRAQWAGVCGGRDALFWPLLQLSPYLCACSQRDPHSYNLGLLSSALLCSQQVKWIDPDTKEEVDTGLVRCIAKVQTAGGGAVDVGGGSAFGGASADEGADDAEESKLDQFWNFPAIEVRRGENMEGVGWRTFVCTHHEFNTSCCCFFCFCFPRTRSSSPPLPSSRRRTSCHSC